jgi:hypothetical protein
MANQFLITVGIAAINFIFLILIAYSSIKKPRQSKLTME